LQRNVFAPCLSKKDSQSTRERNGDGKKENATIEGGRKMKTDLDKHIERQLKDKKFKIYFDKAEAKRILAQAITLLRKAQHSSLRRLRPLSR
jgi:hypothetical protein